MPKVPELDVKKIFEKQVKRKVTDADLKRKAGVTPVIRKGKKWLT